MMVQFSVDLGRADDDPRNNRQILKIDAWATVAV